MSKPFVAILMGSDSDLPVMEAAVEVLERFSIPTEVKISSAHRTPEATRLYVKDAEARGCAVFIAGAGLAAHLAGAVAAATARRVIGVPLDAGSLGGLDSLLSTAQMGRPSRLRRHRQGRGQKRRLPGGPNPGPARRRAGEKRGGGARTNGPGRATKG